jgi:hypothetical protein
LSAHSISNFRRPVGRIAVNDNDLGHEIAWEIREHASDSLRFIMGGNDD